MMSCGEPSGDLYAGALAVEIRRRVPAAAIFGLGGQRLMAGGGELLADYRGISVTGLVEALRVVPRSLGVMNRLIDAARSEKPDALVVIDFPDFNFRLAAAVKKLGIPVIYYISPQLWAWRRNRMRTMKRIADRVLVIFPFEEALYRDAGVPVEFVGHPLVDLAQTRSTRDGLLRRLSLDPRAPTTAGLPGSRTSELRRILPTLVDAATRVRQSIPAAQFVFARAPHLDDRLFAPAHGLSGAAVVEGETDAVLAAADIVMTASGTATVQAALHDKPMVVVYRLSSLEYTLGRP